MSTKLEHAAFVLMTRAGSPSLYIIELPTLFRQRTQLVLQLEAFKIHLEERKAVEYEEGPINQLAEKEKEIEVRTMSCALTTPKPNAQYC